MEQKLERRYGLFTAICMVVGTVIGSGVFFKAQNVLTATGGNMPLGIAAWVITGLLMIICSAMFSVMATKYEKVSGVVDYAEAACGATYGYYLAWFMVNIYYPAMTSVLAWVTARYLGVIFGWSLVSAEVMTLASLFLIGTYALNAFSPKLAGKLQVSATVIKLIPIVLMAIVGVIVGTARGTLPQNFTQATEIIGGSKASGLFAAIVATVFAYEGWIVATSINAELKNPKKNLPIALVIGSLVVVAAYVLYYIGVAGGAPVADLMDPDKGSPYAFSQIFGNLGGVLLNICIVISCLGTLNGLMVGATRGMYAIAARGQGPRPKMFSQVDEATNMTTNSSIWGLLVCCLWMVYFYGANLTEGWFGLFNFDSSELPIVTIYGMYIPIFIMWMVKEKDLGAFKRFILPVLAILACVFMVFAAVYAHGITPYLTAKEAGEGFKFPVLFFLIIYTIIMVIGSAFYNNKDTTLKTNRGLGRFILFSLLTFGIYGLIFYSRLSTDINTIASQHDKKKTMHYYLLCFVVAPLTLGIANLVWWHRISSRINIELSRRGIEYNFGAKTFWLWNVLGSFIVVGPFIYCHKLCTAMNLLSIDYNANN